MKMEAYAESITVSASRPYKVKIGTGILNMLGKECAALGNLRQAVIVSDDTVFPLYGNAVLEAFRAEGVLTEVFLLPHGEQSKNLAIYGNLLEFLSAKHITRNDILIALGGGVVGDLTGFAAATYLRGIRFIQVPTTLLAAVDSSVGGKTAVNLNSGKNQAGCFYQPSLVLCDIKTLETLSEEQYLCGCAEVIKYAVLGDADFFQCLQKTPIREQYASVIAHCVRMKAEFVRADEFDRGERMKLNLGHTFGHAAEACSGYTLLHGMAVAKGMAAIARCAQKEGICSPQTAGAIEEILKQYGFSLEIRYPLTEMVEAVLSDKKSEGDAVSFILPQKIGQCIIQKIPVGALAHWMKEGGIL